MAEGDPEILPSQGESPRTQSIVINQFIQLVNKSSTLPDGESLANYAHEDKEWIKKRVQYEQEQRILLINKLVDIQQAVALNDNNHEHRNGRHRQSGAMIIVGIAVLVSGVLLYLKVGVLSLGVPAVILIAPVATNIGNFITERLKAAASVKDPNAPDAPK